MYHFKLPGLKCFHFPVDYFKFYSCLNLFPSLPTFYVKLFNQNRVKIH